MNGKARYKRSPKEDRTWNGRTYDSKHEMSVAIGLHCQQKSGEISDLKEQVPFILVPKDGKERALTYRADFTFVENGEMIVMDAKGHRTQLYILKKCVLKHFYGIEIREV